MREIRTLLEREPVISVPALIAELPPATVETQLRQIRAALDAVSLAFRTQRPIAPMKPPYERVIEMNMDPSPDIDAEAT